MLTVGIDPGKSGFSCLLGLPSGPRFYPAPVEAATDDEKSRYLLPAMAAQVREWRDLGACLVVVEEQAPRRHGSGKFGIGREGTVASWTNGFGFGAWLASLVAVGFKETNGIPSFVCVDPLVWKRRMGAIGSHSGVDSPSARKRTNDLRSVEVAERVARESNLSIDFRAVEKAPEARVASADKAVSFLLSVYGQRWVLRGGSP